TGDVDATVRPRALDESDDLKMASDPGFGEGSAGSGLRARGRESFPKGGQSLGEPHVFGRALQVAPEAAATGDQVPKRLERIQRELKLVVLQELAVLSQERSILRLLLLGWVRQRLSGALQQRLRDFPALQKLWVHHDGAVRGGSGADSLAFHR